MKNNSSELITINLSGTPLDLRREIITTAMVVAGYTPQDITFYLKRLNTKIDRIEALSFEKVGE